MKDKVAIILGDSPLIKEVEYELPYILNNYFSLGINRIITKFPTTKHIFLDENLIHVTNQYPHIPVITLPKHSDSILNKEKELINTFSFKIDFYGKLEDVKHVNEKGELAWCGFTHDYAISYLISQGYTKIILIGAADFTGEKHYSNDYNFNYAEILKQQSIQYINYLQENNIVELYTLNPDSVLNITKINKDELMKGI